MLQSILENIQEFAEGFQHFLELIPTFFQDLAEFKKLLTNLFHVFVDMIEEVFPIGLVGVVLSLVIVGLVLRVLGR